MDFHHHRAYPLKPKAYPSKEKDGHRERDNAKFMKRDVELEVQKILAEKVGDKPYVYNESMVLTKDLCSDIQAAVQKLKYDRYKLVVQVNIVEACQQGVRISSRCLWDPEVDNFAQVTHSNATMHVTALVFGLYWE